LERNPPRNVDELEFNHFCICLQCQVPPNSTEVIDALTDLFILRGVAAYTRLDIGSDFIC
jgi:hypothetical protein